MTKREQLDRLVSYFANGNKAEFARMLGITKQSLNTWFNHEHLDIEKVLYACPEVSADWLITGDGTMLRDDHPKPDRGAVKKLAEEQVRSEIVASLFDELPPWKQVEVLCLLYGRLDCARKDEFLRKTGNS